MVPARHLLFNQNGPALAVTILAVGALAAALGTVFTVRSAFCNALCPVLPVEQLYGQSPLIQLDRGRCSTCVLCVKTGCLDLTDKVIPQLLGTSRRSARWLLTPHGAFFSLATTGSRMVCSPRRDGCTPPQWAGRWPAT
jgi:hypothetical protein